jgi:AcrR family transcriptional regulator
MTERVRTDGKDRAAAQVRRPRRGYHHGNLREALIDAGLNIVAEEGVDAISLRAVARRAKVSHSAPYHHFAGKAELLAALAAAGFDRMVAAIQSGMEQVRAQEPLERLRTIGRSYVAFAAENPSVFRLMFRPELTKPSEHPLLREAEARAFGTLMQTIGECLAKGQLPSSSGPFLLAACAWSSVHGLATLKVERLLDETPLGSLGWNEVAEHVNNFIVAGMLVEPSSNVTRSESAGK